MEGNTTCRQLDKEKITGRKQKKDARRISKLGRRTSAELIRVLRRDRGND